MQQPISFAGQISPAQVSEIAQMGFKSIINNRPDFEEGPQQPTAEAVGAAATEAGLVYVVQPVVSGQISENDVRTFAEHVNRLEKPILAFCRTGNRCNNLFGLAKQMDLLDDF